MKRVPPGTNDPSLFTYCRGGETSRELMGQHTSSADRFELVAARLECALQELDRQVIDSRAWRARLS